MLPDNNKNWLTKVTIELDRANKARAAGNEGMARVCARRAAGITLGEYFNRLGLRGFGPSVVERLNIFKTLPNESSHAKEIADHLLLKVTEDHNLPIEADIIDETHWLINYFRQRMD